MAGVGIECGPVISKATDFAHILDRINGYIVSVSLVSDAAGRVGDEVYGPSPEGDRREAKLEADGWVARVYAALDDLGYKIDAAKNNVERLKTLA